MKNLSDITNIPHPRTYLSDEALLIELCNRATRINNAIVYTSSFLKDKNGLRDNVRNAGLSLLTASNRTLNGKSLGHDYVWEQINIVLSETSLLDSLIEACAFGRHISQTTAALLQREIRLFAQAIALYRETIEDDRGDVAKKLRDLLSVNSSQSQIGAKKLMAEHQKGQDFLTGALAAKRVKDKSSEIQASTSVIKDNSTNFGIKDISMQGRNERVPGNKGHASEKLDDIQSKISRKSDSSNTGNHQNGDATNRHEIIKNVITSKGKVSVSDILPFVQGCSEKTIQRDLLKMVASGLLIKEGERRWSRYAINSSSTNSGDATSNSAARGGNDSK